MRAILLKGASFRAVLFGDDQRWYTDVDLLVSPDDLDAAVAALCSLGFHDPFAGGGSPAQVVDSGLAAVARTVTA